uniref:Uncharacterized protein n=1 Tax=Sphaerodactylus townsendi TaxID=933632 RepID=A0ACB8EMZ6_9SAUR
MDCRIIGIDQDKEDCGAYRAVFELLQRWSGTRNSDHTTMRHQKALQTLVSRSNEGTISIDALKMRVKHLANAKCEMVDELMAVKSKEMKNIHRGILSTGDKME